MASLLCRAAQVAAGRYFAACILAACIASAFLLPPIHAALAQDGYPARPVRIVLPFGAGGVADSTARIVAEKLGEKLGGRFIVENQPGAGGITAARSVLNAAPDGYTLALFSNGTAVSVPLFKSLPFDPLTEFVPISSLGFFDFVIATKADSGFGSMADVIKAAKEKPGALNVGTINVGSTQNLSAELLKTAAGIDFNIVAHRGTPEVIVSTLQGDVAMMIDSYSALKGPLTGGQMRALASSGAARSQSTPNAPTLQEAGVPGYEVSSWNALFARAGTPPDIIAKLNGALRDTLADPAIAKRLLELGIEAKAGSPEEIAARLRADIDKWRQVIERANIPRQ
jgi:tripartite-type tricarboxylate transporter receptor subunit TctC